MNVGNIYKLIIIPCHSVININNISNSKNDNSWILLPYQKDNSIGKNIFNNILKGFEYLNKECDKSLLIFSGGQTRKEAGPLSEAQSYYYISKHEKIITKENENNIYLEEYSRDSYENLLFSICRFYEITGKYPLEIYIVGFDFKKYRFENLHRKAIGFPKEKFNYVSIDFIYNNKYSEIINGENKTVRQFEKDLYGNLDISLIKKKKERNPFNKTHNYTFTNPELYNLLTWNKNIVYNLKLPWK